MAEGGQHEERTGPYVERTDEENRGAHQVVVVTAAVVVVVVVVVVVMPFISRTAWRASSSSSSRSSSSNDTLAIQLTNYPFALNLTARADLRRRLYALG